MFWRGKQIVQGYRQGQAIESFQYTEYIVRKGFLNFAHVKTKLRMTMTQRRLDNLMLPDNEQNMAEYV